MKCNIRFASVRPLLRNFDCKGTQVATCDLNLKVLCAGFGREGHGNIACATRDIENTYGTRSELAREISDGGPQDAAAQTQVIDARQSLERLAVVFWIDIGLIHQLWLPMSRRQTA